MNADLTPIENLIDWILNASVADLLPLVIALALLLLLLILAIDRGNDEVPRRDETARRLPTPVPASAPPPPAVPVAEPAVPPPEPVPATPAAPQVLVVDDSAVVRLKLRRLLEGAGYGVTVARNGIEALDALGRQHHALLITDLEMPDMSGIELIASVHGSLETEDLPIVAITGHDELQARVHDYSSLYGVFRKPWNDRELLKRIETLVTLRRPPGAAPAAP